MLFQFKEEYESKEASKKMIQQLLISEVDKIAIPFFYVKTK